jgi:hypothetical protein
MCCTVVQRRASTYGTTKLLKIGGCTLQPSSSQRACRTKIIRSCNTKIPLRYAYYRNPLAATSLRNKRRHIIAHPVLSNIVCCLALQQSTPCFNATITITWSNLELGATCCNAHMKFAPTGLLVPIVTPSQMIVTAAATALHTASLKSHHGRVPPAIGTSMRCGARFLKGVLNGACSKA